MRDPGWKRVPTVALDPESVASAHARQERRRLELQIEAERQKQRAERSAIQHRQSVLDRDAPDPKEWLVPVTQLLLIFTLGTGTWGWMAGGAREYFGIVHFLGFMMRPHLVLAIVTSLALVACAHFQIRKVQASNDLQGKMDPAIVKLAETSVDFGFWFLASALGFCLLGWEPVFTVLGGVKVTLGIFVCTGLLFRFAYRLLPR